jgi:hypothetical protein
MKVKIKSLLCNQPKWVTNIMDVNTHLDLSNLFRSVVVDREAIIEREDGKQTTIVLNGYMQTEAYNQRDLLIDWINMRTDEFPLGGEYAKSSI